jgi:type IV fimbrial biogenesis protein FimT
MMVVVVILALLAAIGIPSFENMIQGNRVYTEVNQFADDLQFARSAAIESGSTVSICVSSNGTTCLGNNTWQSGWIVFADVNGSGNVDNAADTVLRVRPAWTATDTFVASPAITSVTFSRDGFATVPTATAAGTGVILLTLHTTPVNAKATRCVSLNRVAHQSVLVGGSGGCL